MRSPLIRTIVLDAVGTVIYPDPGVASVYTEVGRRHGSRLSRDEVAVRFAAAFHDIESRDQLGELRTSEEIEMARWREVVRRVLDDVTDHAACFRELFDHFARADAWAVFPDVPELFAACAKRGVRLAIASNFDRRLHTLARQLKPLDQCRSILVSSEIGYRKPHGRFFEAVRDAIGDDLPHVLYVGDDPENDLAGARSAGLPVRLLDRSGRRGEGALRSLTEVIALIDASDPAKPGATPSE